MRESVEIKSHILEQNIGKSVTIVLDGKEGTNIFQGTLRKEEVSSTIYWWSILSPRGIASNRGVPEPVPETLISFSTDRFSHIIVRQETQEEALEKIQREEASRKGSGLVGADGKDLQ